MKSASVKDQGSTGGSMRRVLRAVIVGVSLMMTISGCASSFEKPASFAREDWGPPPANYEAVIKDYFEMVLKDPESARYKFAKPERAYENAGMLYGGGVAWKGYVVDVDVNAKNSLGGYTGYKRYLVLIQDGTVRRAVEGHSHPLITKIDAP